MRTRSPRRPPDGSLGWSHRFVKFQASLGPGIWACPGGNRILYPRILSSTSHAPRGGARAWGGWWPGLSLDYSSWRWLILGARRPQAKIRLQRTPHFLRSTGAHELRVPGSSRLPLRVSVKVSRRAQFGDLQLHAPLLRGGGAGTPDRASSSSRCARKVPKAPPTRGLVSLQPRSVQLRAQLGFRAPSASGPALQGVPLRY